MIEALNTWMSQPNTWNDVIVYLGGFVFVAVIVMAFGEFDD